jgi:flavin-dependent dehydrogenase
MGPAGENLTFRARTVVNAAGRASSFASTPVSRKALVEMASRRGRLFGCKVHLRGIDPEAEINGLYFFEGGYGGLAHIEDGLTNLCMLIDEELLSDASQDRSALLDRTMRRNPAAREILRDAEPDSSWLSTGPVNFGKPASSQHDSNEIRVGDAYAFIDPFTGSGILRALDGADLGSNIVNRGFEAAIFSSQNLKIECDRALRTVYSQKLRVSSILRRLARDEKSRSMVRNVMTHVPGLARAIARATR